jgi:hypothetical protein
MECDLIEDHATTNPRVTVSGGILEETIEPGSGVRSFKGIPFAAPPVGDLRWLPPPAGSAVGGYVPCDFISQNRKAAFRT